ncbi:hypothetical protein SODALDRAFT_379130 [Sodiomyces alkalinus F11]|uniref:Uncharacterized protein n=1 Tax=Sodiomyces alkalinus (strain CBS 110278 / VKM F-3762 / F11) TaxID=1314773 RepID=A0A3N2PTR6_SODAK|nr:hypothetical protein SODALDRAFT_379130 [Sodiomyces alkalinus F11]ROT37881.1 hypothetical protein SODALDRAFT_379130 [Sodiomyces alkalinus F11]
MSSQRKNGDGRRRRTETEPRELREPRPVIVTREQDGKKNVVEGGTNDVVVPVKGFNPKAKGGWGWDGGLSFVEEKRPPGSKTTPRMSDQRIQQDTVIRRTATACNLTPLSPDLLRFVFNVSSSAEIHHYGRRLNDRFLSQGFSKAQVAGGELMSPPPHTAWEANGLPLQWTPVRLILTVVSTRAICSMADHNQSHPFTSVDWRECRHCPGYNLLTRGKADQGHAAAVNKEQAAPI